VKANNLKNGRDVIRISTEQNKNKIPFCFVFYGCFKVNKEMKEIVEKTFLLSSRLKVMLAT